MKFMTMFMIFSFQMAFAQTPIVLDQSVVDVNETPAVLEKIDNGMTQFTLDMLVKKDVCTKWDSRVVLRRYQEYVCSPGYPGGTYPRYPRGGSYPRNPRGGNYPGGYPRGGAQCRYVTVTRREIENFCAASHIEYAKQAVALNFYGIRKEAQVVISINEDVNSDQALSTQVSGVPSRCLKATKYSKNSLGAISSVSISTKTKRSCRGY